jgi:hypothetical protein
MARLWPNYGDDGEDGEMGLDLRARDACGGGGDSDGGDGDTDSAAGASFAAVARDKSGDFDFALNFSGTEAGPFHVEGLSSIGCFSFWTLVQ